MARKRMIDPNIWQSEDFSKLSTLGKLVFIGLFSLADDEGKGRCNPVYLRSTLFPYDENLKSTDIDKTLLEISSNMSIIFYSNDGSNYYSLYNWSNWQKIDKPSKSKIPDYDEEIMTRLFDEHSTNTSRILDEHSTPNKNKNKNINRKEKEEKRNKIVELYNSTCTNLPSVQKITDKRSEAIDSFIKEFSENEILEIFNIANNSEFLTGNNDRNWKADFDFVIKPDKATAILEGKYSTSKGGFNDFKDLWKEAVLEDEQTGNCSSDNSFSW